MPRFTPRVFFLLPADPHSSQILSSHLAELGGHVRTSQGKRKQSFWREEGRSEGETGYNLREAVSSVS